MYLTCLNPFFCIFNALYTLLTLFILSLSYPFKTLFSSSCLDFSDALTSHLSSPLYWHPRFTYPHPHLIPRPDELSAGSLVVVHLVSPLLAVPVWTMAAAVALVWLYTEGLLRDKHDNDGCEYKSFLWVKQRWDKIMLASLKGKKLEVDNDEK
ncbi:hypothetical protein FN846DRAFT_990626 [Sphaerosporella brunnea]|uniref:Uncharacterized protein n=1 Tax=Sphaerosporella brunnea TaxID=1250544 RepID=A0A5J5EPB9_9PEZI|nr:hypothetical protein FN846DRAFT_990626 [Sphaerosporella brunnea]